MIENNDIKNQLFGQLEKLLIRQDDFSQDINELRNEINLLKYWQDQESVEGKRSRTDKLNLGLDSLLKKQADLSKEINELRFEINKLTNLLSKEQIITEQPASAQGDKSVEITENLSASENQQTEKEYTPTIQESSRFSLPDKSDIEKFIGENLINKIGIAITIIGVAIGAKYSIEHGWISPLTRIIFGYLVGLGLLGFGIKLKKDYESYSAVLVSGAIAIMYFITYAAYDFYGLVPQVLAFGLMFVFTAFTVLAAINYNKQLIAHIGLVGAYAVPFILSENSGKVAVLFSYISIINIGILIIAIKKYWKPLYYSSFVISWLIYAGWFVSRYSVTNHFSLSLTFLTIFFFTFYLIFLIYKLIRKELFELGDILLLLANSFIFFGFGYAILDSQPTGTQLLGLFALCNALIHFIVSVIIYKQKLADRNIFFLIAGLVLVFITITIPIQLDGNWVTLLWTGEAALLFWVGRTKKVPFYEKASYPLMLIAFASLLMDWLSFYNAYDDILVTPIFNINFLSSTLFIATFAFINYLNNKEKKDVSWFKNNRTNSFFAFAIPGILLVALYFSFRMEISSFWDQLYQSSKVDVKNSVQGYNDLYFNMDLTWFKSIWLINYSLLFFSLLTFVNILKIKNRNLGIINLVLNVCFVVVFLTQGLFILGNLKESYLLNTLSEYYQHSSLNIGLRYISYTFVALLFFSIYRYIEQEFLQLPHLKVAFDALLSVSILWVASSEMITWLDLMHFSGTFKLGLSILWGIYALLLIVIGIWKKKKHLRIGAIGLFAITLVKLFLYDISELNTIAKTIVFVSLGLLLLIISFLYNKYKFIISNNNED